MAEDSENDLTDDATCRKRSKIITKTDSKQEANKDTQLVKMFCVDLGPYYILKGSGFREFIKKNIPNYSLPSMKTFSEELIPEQYNRAKKVLMKTLDSVHHVAISIDTWKWPDPVRRYRNMLTATIHFVQHGKHVSQNLFTMEANFRLEKNIANAFRKELVKWGVFKKMVCFISNTGKNEMLLKQAVTDDFNVPHVTCATATINCAIEDVLNYLRFKEFERKYNKGNSESTKSKKKDEPFSWYYLYNMLKDISENNAGDFNANERRIHSECVKMLKPFEEFYNTLSSEQYVTLSCILPQLANVKSKINECSTRTALAAQIKQELLRKIDKIFNNYECYPTTHATFLDPRYKKAYFTQEKAESVEKDIINEFNECVNSTCTQQNPIPSTSSNQSEEKRNLLGASTGEKIMSQVRSDVERYVAAPPDQSKDPFQYWEQYNNLYKHNPANLYITSQKYLCIPATAIPVKTTSGDFLWKKNDRNYINYNERRTSLEFKDIEKMLFLHSYYYSNRNK